MFFGLIRVYFSAFPGYFRCISVYLDVFPCILICFGVFRFLATFFTKLCWLSWLNSGVFQVYFDVLWCISDVFRYIAMYFGVFLMYFGVFISISVYFDVFRFLATLAFNCQ